MTYLILLLLVGALWFLLWRYKQRRDYTDPEEDSIEFFYLDAWTTTGPGAVPPFPFIKVFHVRWYTSVTGPSTRSITTEGADDACCKAKFGGE